MNTDARIVEDINIPKSQNAVHCLLLHPLRIGFVFSHQIIHPVQEWSWSQRQFWFCFIVTIHLFVSINESVRVLCVHNGSHRSIIHQFIRFSLLRRQSFINIPFWVAWWVSAYNGSLRSIVLLSLQTQRRLTFVSGFPRTFWCSRR